MRHASLPTVVLALALIACDSKSAARGPTPAAGAASRNAHDGALCNAMQTLIAAAEGDFASLRKGEPSKLMPSWQSSVTLPGASTCRVADKDPVSFGSVFCVMAESADQAEIDTAQSATVAQVKACLTGWKAETGEQLGTSWVELEPATQKSSNRSLQVHVRKTDPVANARGSVTVDIAVKRPGVNPPE